ncbi:hypothetical protein AB0E08_41445 [Streptomyces sp. NPDC048281]|uniref:hypothetical protein n=1 Tax=Streptomyces sp. NPDC048281 TaxID=3154715 RepID=UPI00341C7E25
MDRPKRPIDLVAFVAALLTVVTLLHMGVQPQSLALVVLAVATLYGAFGGPGSGEHK